MAKDTVVHKGIALRQNEQSKGFVLPDRSITLSKLHLDAIRELLKTPYDAIIGDVNTNPFATHDSFEAALADGNLATKAHILVADDININATVTLDKPNWRIEFKPGVTATRVGGNPGFEVDAEHVEFLGGRFSGWSGVGEIVIQYNAGGNFGRIVNCSFDGAETNFVDNSTSGLIEYGNITE